MGRAFLCGVGQALKAICPPDLLRGEPAPLQEGSTTSGNALRESSCFDPWDEARAERYLRFLEQRKQTLVRPLFWLGA